MGLSLLSLSLVDPSTVGVGVKVFFLFCYILFSYFPHSGSLSSLLPIRLDLSLFLPSYHGRYSLLPSLIVFSLSGLSCLLLRFSLLPSLVYRAFIFHASDGLIQSFPLSDRSFLLPFFLLMQGTVHPPLWYVLPSSAFLSR